MKIITNNHKHDLLSWEDLTSKEKKDCNEGDTYFRYKGNVYQLSDFMRTDGIKGLEKWDGYTTDSAFSGTLVKYPLEDWGDIDYERIIVGWFYS